MHEGRGLFLDTEHVYAEWNSGVLTLAYDDYANVRDLDRIHAQALDLGATQVREQYFDKDWERNVIIFEVPSA